MSMTNQIQFQAILFDFFDVIYADSLKRWYVANGIKNEGAIHILHKEMDQGEIDVETFISRLAILIGKSPRQIFTELDEYRILNEEILPLIKNLRRNYQIGVLSNAESAYLRGLLQEFNLEPLFHHIVISSEVGMVKPNREIFDHILSKMKIEPRNAIFIDDNEKNVQAAQKLGISGIVYTDMSALRSDLDTLGIIT